MSPLTSEQVAAYLGRLDLRGEFEPDLASLDHLIASNLKCFPFENVDVLIDRSIQLERDAVFEKGRDT